MTNIQRNLIIFVCTANICRSPMAEKLLDHALKNEPSACVGLKVISAGISAFDGEAASPYSVQALKKVGIDLSMHRSQLLTEELVSRSFAIFCMTSTHKLLIEHQFLHCLPKHLYLLREWINSSDGMDIIDPYGSSLNDYETCRDNIVQVIPSIVHFLKKEYNSYPTVYEN